MRNKTRNRERGVALFFSIFALLLLTAIGAAMIFMAGTETSVNYNYRQEQMAYFAAKAGLEEARARMMQSDPASIVCGPVASAPCAGPLTGNANYPLFDPGQVALPTSTNQMIYYITNPGSGAAVQPWAFTVSGNANPYVDDELCHEGYTGFNVNGTPPEERCQSGSYPASTTWYQSTSSFTSTLPYTGTANALPYKWVRIAPKLNGSANYLSGSGKTPTTATYSVDTNTPATVAGVTAAITGTTPVCWDGNEEVPLTISAAPAIANCSQMSISAGLLSGAKMTEVYVVTSLGVSPSGARKMVQADVALQPSVPFPYGLYATSNACPAIDLHGGTKLTIDAYTPTAGGGMTILPTGGDMGSNGGVNIGNGTVDGIVGVLQAPPTGNGNCATPLASGPGGTMLGTIACPSGNAAACYLQNPYKFPPPVVPVTPNTAASIPACPPVGKGKGSSGDCITPGIWGNISENGPLTMAAGTYYVNSLSMGGNAVVTVNPPGGTITLYVGGCGDLTCSPANQLASPISVDGNGYAGPNDSNGNDFIINYGGSGAISVGGNGNITAIVNAPNAAITLHGGGKGAWSGAILGSTVTLTGTETFNYDKNAALAPVNNGYYTMIAYHEVPY
jgi:hypothetical protein